MRSRLCSRPADISTLIPISQPGDQRCLRAFHPTCLGQRCMLWCMQRTNIYLTEDQQRALDVRARRAGTNRSAVLREILDAELAQTAAPVDQVRAKFAEMADQHAPLGHGRSDQTPPSERETG